MKTIGITGGIGSGKSVVSQILRELGYPVYDCDERAKILMIKSPIIKSSLKSLIGEDVYINDDELNKGKMSSYIFLSEQNLKRVNSIVHPQVGADFSDWKLHQNSDIVFIESAILFESGLNNMVDEVWCVVADKEERISRVMRRSGLTREAVLARINSQMSDNERTTLSDYVIDNNSSSSLLKQLIKILGDI